MHRDLEVLEWCSGRGLRVPEVLEHGLSAGWLLLEDLGPDDAEQTLRATAHTLRAGLLGGSLAPLEILAHIDPAELPTWNQPLDRDRLRWELAGFELWYLRHLRDRSPSIEIGRWLDELAVEVGEHPRRVCHRDYHLNNLFFTSSGEVAVIDIQDILAGPDTYDAVSMVAERSALELLDKETRREWLEQWARVTEATPGWRERWPRVRLQRALKVLGTFARLTVAGREGYRRWMDELARRLVSEAGQLDLPTHVTQLLLD
jgi:aminoglycoside/choline kinase family phosphotransferase